MELANLFACLVWILTLVAMNHAQPEEPSYNEQVMKVCRKQKTTKQLMYSFKVSTLNQCAVRCTSDTMCQSANLCSTGHGLECTLSGSYPENKCDGNIANDDCRYLVTENPCLHGGTLNAEGLCSCAGSYTGQFCERLYYDCNETDPDRRIGNTWIQRGGYPPLMLQCDYGVTSFFEFINTDGEDAKFPFQRQFEEYKRGFMIGYTFLMVGLEAIHTATTQAYYILVVFVNNGEYCRFIHYNNFTLGSESEGYRLDYLSKTYGGPDVMASMKNRPFSAIGNDPDGCVKMHDISWWYTADCQRPMIYNDNGKISITYSDDEPEALQLDFYLSFVGFK